jgi:hypothetical protein
LRIDIVGRRKSKVQKKSPRKPGPNAKRSRRESQGIGTSWLQKSRDKPSSILMFPDDKSDDANRKPAVAGVGSAKKGLVRRNIRKKVKRGPVEGDIGQDVIVEILNRAGEQLQSPPQDSTPRLTTDEWIETSPKDPYGSLAKEISGEITCRMEQSLGERNLTEMGPVEFGEGQTRPEVCKTEADRPAKVENKRKAS